jgi:hypothetical protein
MPPTAFAVVGLFTAISVVVGVVAWSLAVRAGGARSRRWAVPPVLAAFAAFYLIGHRLGISVGPEIRLFTFDIALLGDTMLGSAAAAAVAAVQLAVTRRRGTSSAA